MCKFFKTSGQAGINVTPTHGHLWRLEKMIVACAPHPVQTSVNQKHMNTFLTLGGRIRCLQCNAKSKRTGLTCRAVAIRGKTKCRHHGGFSTGPKTPEGRKRCAQAKTKHGFETRQARAEQAEGMRRLRALEDLGHALGMMTGPKTPGRKPKV